MESANSDTRSRIVRLLADILQVEIPDDVDDFRRETCEEWDSVNHLHLVMELEEEFEITLEDEQAANLTSLRDIESALSALTT
jgi:acyl carrier protein